MRNLESVFLSRLLMGLLSLQLLAGVPLCQEWAHDLDGHAEVAATLHAAASHGHGGANGQDHSAAGGHAECPETFLVAAGEELSALSLAGRAPSPPEGRFPSPAYDVPTPVPIVSSS